MKQSRIVKQIIFFVLVVCWHGVAMADYLSVRVPEANIRSGPGVTYDILWKVETYHPLLILKKTGQWYHFQDFEGDEGWIHKSLLQKVSSVITKKENCNVRSEPGTQSGIVFIAEKGIPFKVLKRKGKWMHIQHADGDKGWIHRPLVWPNE